MEIWKTIDSAATVVNNQKEAVDHFLNYRREFDDISMKLAASTRLFDGNKEPVGFALAFSDYETHIFYFKRKPYRNIDGVSIPMWHLERALNEDINVYVTHMFPDGKIFRARGMDWLKNGVENRDNKPDPDVQFPFSKMARLK